MLSNTRLLPDPIKLVLPDLEEICQRVRHNMLQYFISNLAVVRNPPVHRSNTFVLATAIVFIVKISRSTTNVLTFVFTTKINHNCGEQVMLGRLESDGTTEQTMEQ